ncbi:DNA-3-methyladenine glycosidase [Methylopila jiangsuensis]|uniref:DNA-3-methyladenine glycosylase II n=1 Tax=Methylopila jiangsuensis TaxID=586230 RepID=A0A9W6N590_9HYPH|nr:DNA-3-methyladenine glycosylase 2 family protein [Methylopila jiangsuensis]MDR6284454.1 DNA-3-methyladenine glycosylase II [Methylopila jiangsuensis]GLK78160.1 DNA-3-methyladenine glycosidase [Methylopila jiangsuensis]
MTACERILTEADLAAALDRLTALDPKMGEVRAASVTPPLRTIAPDLSGLVWVVNSQMISTAAARAIHGRLEAALGRIDAEALAAASDDAIRAAGVSRPKLRTLRAIAGAVADGLDLPGLAALPEPEARARLLAISGVGPWTADVFLLFAHGRADAFPAGDIAVQEALKRVFGLETRPDARTAERMADGWRPLRGVAAQLLWAYYLTKRGGRDAAPAPNRPASPQETA